MERLQLVGGFGRHSDLPISRISTFNPIASSERLELLECLMAQDKLGDLLQTFATWAGNHLPICRLAYHYMTQKHKLIDGERKGTKQSFALQDSSMQYLGRLEYEFAEPLSPHQQRMLQQLHPLLALPLRMLLKLEQMDQRSRMDHLTGIGNRAYFDEALQRSVDQNLRHADGLTLLLMDLDHFKQVNDTYGHPVGDKVLKAFADVLSRCIRRTDIAFRLGGDEFALLLQPADACAAKRVRARINF
ncbi:MAG: GGDEF domain-containing protein, partial [Aeromonadaceae bacterium]